MKSAKASEQDDGFTLIEIIITLAMIAFLVGLSVPFTMDFYRQYRLDGEQTILVSILRSARARSLTSQGGASHGIHVASSQFTLFEGSSYAARNEALDEIFDRSSAVSISAPAELVFSRITGLTASVSFTLNDAIQQKKIYVNTEGTIDYE